MNACFYVNNAYFNLDEVQQLLLTVIVLMLMAQHDILQR